MKLSVDEDSESDIPKLSDEVELSSKEEPESHSNWVTLTGSGLVSSSDS